MAPAVLASRSLPLFLGQCGDVYMRKYTNNSVSDNNNQSPLFNLSPNLNPNPNLNTTHWLNQTKGIDNSSSNGGYVTFNIGSYDRNQLKELKKRLISELEQVRILRDRAESDNFENRPVFAAPEIPTVRSSPPGTYSGDTAKTSDLGSNRKKNGPGLKRGNPFGTEQTDVKRLAAVDPEAEKVLGSMMRRCGQILVKLMKHKWSWVFNQPVDVVGLGLHDYYHVIEKPMDLGTVKLNLEKGLYRSPLDFASDVRLTFNNALTYNPKGHDVYLMAEQLLGKFDEMFDPAYKKFEAEQQKFHQSIAESSLHQPLKSRVWNQNRVAENVKRGPEPISIAKELESVTPLVPVVEPKSLLPPSPPESAPAVALVEAPPEVAEPVKVRKGKLPKPKAKDPNKRLMTMEEKAKLGLNLQELPPEKLGQLVHILRKRNSHLAQDGDEIELDIEVIDNETLWELDRFVTNYKKMVSKIKRQGFIQNQILTTPRNPAPVSEMASAEKKGKKGDAGEEDVDIGEDIPMADYPSVEIEKDATAASSGSGSSGSSSSSSSGSSSSSDSDSGRSSGSGSDADTVQSPFVESKEAQ